MMRYLYNKDEKTIEDTEFGLKYVLVVNGKNVIINCEAPDGSVDQVFKYKECEPATAFKLYKVQLVRAEISELRKKLIELKKELTFN
jgi:hypothetical protein